MQFSEIQRGAVYIRKSREDEEAERRGEDTLTAQRELLLYDVLPNYPFPVDIYEEIGSGDSIKDRPVFRDLLPQVGQVYTAVICKDISRLGRGSYADMGQVYDRIVDHQVFIITRDKTYDPTNDSDLRMIRFSLFMSREEFELTRWRLTNGKYDGAKRGRWVAGSVPYGYRYNPKSRKLDPNETAAEVVRIIFRLYADEGLGCRAIATRLRRLGHRTPQGKAYWQPEVIRRILHNPAYAGTLAFRLTKRNRSDGRVVKRPIPEHIVIERAFIPLIPSTTWFKTQQRLTAGPSAAQPRVKMDATTSELAGLIRCKACNRLLIRQANTRSYRKVDGSVSRYEREFLYCKACGYMVSYRACEQRLLHVMERLGNLDSQELTMQLARRLNDVPDGELNPVNALARLQERLIAADRRLARARELLVRGTFDEADYQALKATISAEKRDLQRGIADAEQRQQADNQKERIRPDDVRQNIETILCVYRALHSTANKNALLRRLVHSAHLALVARAQSKRQPAKFDLHVVLSADVAPYLG